MTIDYMKLWKMVYERGLSRADLVELTGISNYVSSRLMFNQPVFTHDLLRVCKYFKCTFDDIMEIDYD